MAQLSDLIPRIFRQAWTRYGKPTATVVRPLAAWSLPAGFSYEANVDTIRNAAGTVLPNPEDYWATDIVYIVPTKSNLIDSTAQLASLLAGGVTLTGTIDIWVLEDDIAKTLACHALKIGNRWYTVSNTQPAPSGYPGSSELWARVTLQGRS